MPEEVVDAPVTLPESTTFEQYEASRTQAANDSSLAAVLDPYDAVDAISPEFGQSPEVTDPAPVEETTAAVATEPVAPEPATEPAPVGETQEQKQEREKKQGIPQARLDEVTKARREAERERDAVKAENERLAKELAEAKIAPAKTEPVAAAAENPKPVAPNPPILDDFGGDWDKFQTASKEYHKVTYPAYVEELSDYKADQRDIANKKKADEAAAATRKQAEDNAKAKADQAEAEAKVSWESQLQAVRDAHPDFDEKVKTTPASAAMIEALQAIDNGGVVAHWLTAHPEDAKRIADATGMGKELSTPQFKKAVIKAATEFAKVETSTASPNPAPVAQPAVPALPVNPKPNATKAPRPPSPVSERSGPTVKSTADAKTFDDYEKAWLAKQALKTTRR